MSIINLGETERRQCEKFVADLALETVTFPVARFSGRGIVVCAGGARMFTNAYVLIRTLRETLGCELPIEVWHFGSEELSPAMVAILENSRVACVDALPLIEKTAPMIRDGWQLKSFALVWCRFLEVLLLDADQVPVIDPSSLFDRPEYRETGAIFWPDIVDVRADNPVWSIFELESTRQLSLESGQLLIDKSRHWDPLVTALRVNERADLFYRLIYGDKDSFLLAWMFRKANYTMIPHRPYIDERYLVQRDFEGNPLFQHRTNAKWNYAGDQLKFTGFLHEAACLFFLDELRQIWGGRVFNAPDRNRAAREVENELIQLSPLILEIGDDTVDEIELRPFGEIGTGRTYDRQNWWVEPAANDYQFVITDGSSRTYELRFKSKEYWIGRRSVAPSSWVQLKPKPSQSARSTNQSVRSLCYDTLAAGYVTSDGGASL